jgi:hypothetical protein
MTHHFLWGALAATGMLAGVYFLKFFLRSRDRLFLAFALAFWLLALNWTVLAIGNTPDESHHYVMVIRLVAFLVLIAGIVDKNRRP